MTSPEQYHSYARAALPAFGFGHDSDLELLNLSENGTFRVRDGERTAILRVHREGYHGRYAIESELAWLDALRAEAGIRTPVPIPATDGGRVVEVEHARFAVLFEPLPGREPAEDDLTEKFHVLGELTARMHAHAATWRRPSWFRRFAWDLPAMLGDRPRWGSWTDGMGVGPAERAVLGAAADRVVARLNAFGAGPERFGLIHADMRLANLLVDGRDIYVIDFDDCGFGWYLYDLGAALSFLEHDPRVPEWCDSWSRGYRAVRPLPPSDVDEIPTFVMLRRLMLVAWIGSHAGTDLAREMGRQYTSESCALAEQYLTTTKGR